MLDVAPLFEPFSVKGKLFRNRIIMPPMVVNRNHTTKESWDWYGSHARGGASPQLLCQLSKSVPILLGRFDSYSQGALNIRVIGGQQDSTIRLHGQNAVAGLQPQAIGHVFGECRADRAAGLAEGHFPGHASRVAHKCYEGVVVHCLAVEQHWD